MTYFTLAGDAVAGCPESGYAAAFPASLLPAVLRTHPTHLAYSYVADPADTRIMYLV